MRIGVDGRESILCKKEREKRGKEREREREKIIGTPHVGVTNFRGEATCERKNDPHPIQYQWPIRSGHCFLVSWGKPAFSFFRRGYTTHTHTHTVHHHHHRNKGLSNKQWEWGGGESDTKTRRVFFLFEAHINRGEGGDDKLYKDCRTLSTM